MTFSILRPIAVLTATTALSGCILDDIPIGTGYAAKYMCSGLWVSGLDEDRLKDDFIAPQISPLPLIWKIDINERAQTVTVRDVIFGSRNAKTAYYREGLGCTLTHDATLAELDAQAPVELINPVIDYQAPWPFGEAPVSTMQADVDYNLLDSAMDEAFTETGDGVKNTLSVAVIRHGELIAERYSDDVDESSRLLSWSMAKSITATMTGLLYDRGVLNPQSPAPVAEWAGDERSAIRLKDMLQMAAGLDWNEAAQGDDPDQGYGLFEVPDMAGYYAAQEATAQPGTVFNYSTGESNLIARIVQEQLGGSLDDYYQFIQQELFLPLNINTAVVEFDTEGQPVGGAFHYLTTRDWARLGLLYLNHGNWFGEQILSADWISQALTPSAANPLYGYQIWLNTDQGFWPTLPASTFAFRGFQSQIVMMIPEYDMVLVRTGVTFDGEGASSTVDPAGIETLANGVISAVSPQ